MDNSRIIPSSAEPGHFEGGLCNLVLYETAARYFIIGSNSMQTRFKILKVDRSEPRELVINDDGVEYTETELSMVLGSLDQGNRGKGHRSTMVPPGLNRRLSAFGLVGFVKFLEGYSMILITKRRKVAAIGYHFVYKIEETEMVPLMPESVVVMSPLEQRYHKTFQTIDLSSNFYYSYSYDITHALQHNMVQNVDLEKSSRGEPSWRYVWNEYLLKQLVGRVGTDWILPVIHGYVCQSEINVFSRSVLLTVVARRSNRFAGTRFLKRGANSQGHVANEIEVEQIVHDTTYRNRRFTSFVQLRGSVPGYWSQESSKMTPKPPIVLHRVDPFSGSAGAHFGDLLGRYGAPICCLNLVKKREIKKHESLLTDELSDAIAYLNQFLQSEHHIRYIGFDMARANKRGLALDSLEIISNKLIKHVGFFCSFPELFCHLLRCDAFYREVQHLPVDTESSLAKVRKQHGTIRINCVDCLDRTNTAAFVVGKCVLGLQVYALGLVDSPHLSFDTDAVRMLEDMFEDLGNVLALQYGGSQLVHRVDSYRHHGWGTNSKDWMRTISRYYSNTFSDFDKQAAINLFLGIFEPSDKAAHLWELQSDYFLHHPWIRDPLKHPPIKGYSKWLSEDVASALPDAYEDVTQDTDHYVSFDAFFCHYKTFQLGSFKEVFTSMIPKTDIDYMPSASADPSPFVARNQSVVPFSAPSLERLNFLPSSSPVNLSSDGPHDSDFGGDSSETGTDIVADVSTKSVKNPAEVVIIESKSFLQSKFPSFEERYGMRLREPNSKDKSLYTQFSRIGHNATKLTNEKSLAERLRSSSTQLIQRSVFSMDSSYEVTPPTVNRHSRDLYHDYVEKKERDDAFPGVADMNLYRKFVLLN